jgi:hypothetical protein
MPSEDLSSDSARQRMPPQTDRVFTKFFFGSQRGSGQNFRDDPMNFPETDSDYRIGQRFAFIRGRGKPCAVGQMHDISGESRIHTNHIRHMLAIYIRIIQEEQKPGNQIKCRRQEFSSVGQGFRSQVASIAPFRKRQNPAGK